MLKYNSGVLREIIPVGNKRLRASKKSAISGQKIRLE